MFEVKFTSVGESKLQQLDSTGKVVREAIINDDETAQAFVRETRLSLTLGKTLDYIIWLIRANKDQNNIILSNDERLLAQYIRDQLGETSGVTVDVINIALIEFIKKIASTQGTYSIPIREV